jgi:hypothetical protein
MGAREMANRGLVVFTVIGVAWGCARSQTETEQSSSLTGSCAWIAGRWTFNGCDETTCTFYEDNCQVHYGCSGPGNGISGSGMIVDNKFTFGGGQCTATVDGKSISGRCPTCSFTASHK